MNFGFNPFEQLDTINYTIDIHLGNSVETHSASQPSFFAIQQAIQLCQQLAQDSRPMKAVWKMPQYIKGRNEGDKWIESTVEFGNEAWVREFGKE